MTQPNSANLETLSAPPVARPNEPAALIHSGLTTRAYRRLQIVATAFPLSAGILLYGWRAAGATALLWMTMLLAAAVWKRAGRFAFDLPQGGGYGVLLLSLAIPAHLFSLQALDGMRWPWLLLVSMGLLLAILRWLEHAVGWEGVRSVLLCIILFGWIFPSALTPRWVLQRGHLILGDLRDAPSGLDPSAVKETWTTRKAQNEFDAIRVEPPVRPLSFFSRGQSFATQEYLSIDGLLREFLPPLEDVVIAGQAAPIGQASGIAIIIGGLFLIYRGLIDYRIPVLILAATGLTLLLLPTPIALTPTGVEWRWMTGRDPAVGWATALTFMNYHLLASPLLLMAFFFATDAGIRPLDRRSRVLFALLVGVLAGGAQLYVSTAYGPFMALLAVSLFTPLLDSRHRARPLI